MRKWETRSFLERKRWLKDDIYWLLKRSCFELFSDGKYGLFLSQEVDGKMIFTGYWEVLVLNFSVMGNTVFFLPKSRWKDDTYMVFLSFLWYSKTWETCFFAQRVCWCLFFWNLFSTRTRLVLTETVIVKIWCELV